MRLVVITYENGIKRYDIDYTEWQDKIPYHGILLVYWQDDNGAWNRMENKDYYFVYEFNGVIRVGGLDSPQNHTNKGIKTEFQLQEISTPKPFVKRGIWIDNETYIKATKVKP